MKALRDNLCVILAYITHTVFVQREMFLNLIVPGAQGCSWQFARPQGQSLAWDAPVSELSSAHFITSKQHVELLLKAVIESFLSYRKIILRNTQPGD